MPDPETLTGEPPEATLQRIIELGFGGDEDRFRRFVELLRDEVPGDVEVMLRGSSVTGTRWEDGAPFDADGPGSSDLDLTFLGATMLKFFEKFYIPGLHTAPLCDEHLDVAPQIGDRDVLNALEEPGLMVVQQEHHVGRIEQRLATSGRQNAGLAVWRRWHGSNSLPYKMRFK